MHFEYRESQNVHKSANYRDAGYVGFEVLTPVLMKSSWDITLCSSLKVNRRFGRTCRLHLQGLRMSQSRNQCESRRKAEPSSSIVKMGARYSSENVVTFQGTIWRYISQDRTLRDASCFMQLNPLVPQLVTSVTRRSFVQFRTTRRSLKHDVQF
jgi:hypothetical protein